MVYENGFSLKKRLFLLLASTLSILAPFQNFAQCHGDLTYQPMGIDVTCPEDQYVLVFHDEFNGSILDQNKWFGKLNNPTPADRFLYHSCNRRERQVYLEENLSISNGVLSINAEEENYTYSGIAEDDLYCNNGNGNTLVWRKLEPFAEEFQFSSGAITGKVAFSPESHLLMEMRCKIPKGVGLWPAFWTWNQDEIDVFEFFNSDEDDCFQTNYHANGYECGANVSSNNLSSDFHTYSVEITPWWIKWYLDGEAKRVVAKYYIDGNPVTHGIPATINCDQFWPQGTYTINSGFPDMDERWFAPIINLAISPDKSAEEISGLPAAMEVDYVRIYTRLPENHANNLCRLQAEAPELVCIGQTFNLELNTIFPLNELNITSSM